MAGMSLSVMVFLFGCATVPSLCLRPEEAAAYAPYAPAQEIRILTINVWSGLTYKGAFRMARCLDDPEKRYKALVAATRRLSPDIIAIQEANPLPRYAQRLAADVGGYDVVSRVALGGLRFGPIGIPTNLREGDAILVKKPWTVADLGRKRLGGSGIATNWLCFHFGEITQAVLARTVVNGKPLYVYAVHLHASPFRGQALDSASERLTKELPHDKARRARERVEEGIRRRRREIAKLTSFIGATLPAGMSAILLGDFNTTAESGELDSLLADGEWVDSYRLVNPRGEGSTWDPARNPNFRPLESPTRPYDLLRSYHSRQSHRIDFILVRGNIPRERIVESRVVLTPSDGFCPSDHYGVLTTLRW